MSSKVYFTDFRCPVGTSRIDKIKMLCKAAGIDKIDFDGKFTAIKMHFGELGNLAFLRPNYAKAIADIVKEKGGKSFLTDCNTLYPGSRKNALDHLDCAELNGFNTISTGCHVIIGDGLRGTDETEVPIDGEYIKSAKIGKAIMDADVIISLTHFKGHEMTGFGGTIKNLGMGSGSRAGKKEQHSNGKPHIEEELCRGCRRCSKECANGGLVFDPERRKMTVDKSNCVGCGRCLGACNFDAIVFDNDSAMHDLNCKMAEYTKAVVDSREQFHISLIVDVSPNCDCHAENDAPILPDIGMLCSRDPLALDQACVDLCLQQAPLENSQLSDHLHSKGFVDLHDHFCNNNPESEYRSCLEHAEKIGLGSRSYTLIKM